MKMRRSSTKGRRGLRVASVVREVVSKALVTELNDPRMAFVTVTGVDIAADLRFADVRISVLGKAKEQKECLRAIKHAQGRIQNEVAQALSVKFCPLLRFHVDTTVKQSVELSAIIRQAREEDEAARADRIRRGVESPDAAPEVPEESAPILKVEVEEPSDDDDDFDEDEHEVEELGVEDVDEAVEGDEMDGAPGGGGNEEDEPGCEP
jgi:ribosome-binding factor A